jgi:hypothetical protein
MFMKDIVIIMLIAVTVAGCSCKNESDLEQALEYAEKNRPELERVLEHYRGDSLKYEAAVFLIKNMPGHYSYSDTAYMNAYYAALDSAALLYEDKDNPVRDSVRRIFPYFMKVMAYGLFQTLSLSFRPAR